MHTRYTILIIDDEKIVRSACKDILGTSNYRVISAFDGYNGLKRVKKYKPDLVFIDLRMPNISGLKVLERIYSMDPSIVSIVITCDANICSAVEVMRRGAFDYLLKPFTPEEFLAITKRGLERRKLIIENKILKEERELLRQNTTSIIAEKLRNPISVVQQNLIILLERLGGDLNPNQRLILQLIKERIGELIHLLDIQVANSSSNNQKKDEQGKIDSIPPFRNIGLEIMSQGID